MIRFPGPAPAEALAFFRAKGLKVSFDWRDVWRQEHATAFTVAKAMQLDVLEAIRGEIDKALAEGRTLRDFRKDLTPTLQRLGWWGKQEMVDPDTGELVEARLGSPRRLRTIYNANLRTARAAGQWDRAQRTKAALPFFRYSLGPSEQHRELHQQWNGTILPVDHPWWSTHMPPNGWGCKCRVRQVSQAEMDRRGWKKSGNPLVRHKSWVNERTGKTSQIPEGIDPGWDTNPGRLRSLTSEKRLREKVVAVPPKAARVVEAQVEEYRQGTAPFSPAKSVPAAEAWAKDNGLAAQASYKGLALEAANEMNAGIADAQKLFPALRGRMDFIGSAQGRNRTYIDFHKKKMIDDNGEHWRSWGRDPEKEAERYLRRRIGRLPPNVWAQSTSHQGISGIAYNEKFFAPKVFEATKESMVRNVATRFHPEGCDTVKSLIDHEMAHQIDDLFELRKSPEIAALYKSLSYPEVVEGLSTYAATNTAEFIAEGWAEFRNNPNPRPLARQIGEIILRRAAP